MVTGYGNLPAWAADDPCALFEAADRYERSNGRLFVEIEVALPNELSEAQQRALVQVMAAAVTAPGLPFTYSIHAGRPKSPGEPANPHAHILISERVTDGIPRSAERWFRRANRKNPGSGGAAKDRGMKEVSWVKDTRNLIEGLINEHLEQARVAERVTADSHATRIEKALAAGDIETAEFLRQRPPGMHLGPTVAALERDRFRQKEGEGRTLSRAGEPTDRGDYQRAIAADSERLVVELAANTAALDGARAELQQAEQWVEAAWSAGLADDEVLRIYETSELAEAGAGWASVESAAAAQVERKAAAETAAGEFPIPIDVEALCRSARDRGVDPVSVLEEATASFAAARTALLPDGEVRRIHAAAEFSEPGTGWTAVKASSSSRQAQKEAAEAGAATFGLDIEGVYAGAQAGGADPVEALAEKVAEEERLSSELDDREERLVKSAGSNELLVEAFRELCAPDASFGDGSSLPERWQIITQAEKCQEEDRAEEAEWSAALDGLEAMLKETSRGAQYLAAAQQEVLGEGKEPATLEERDLVVITAWWRVEQELDGREQALAARCCEDGSIEVGGAWLYAIKVTELEAGQQQHDGPSPGCREQALAWAWQQMDRLDALRQEEALDLFFEKLVELEPARGSADIAEEEQRAAAARRQDRVAARSELVFVEEKRAALDPQGREVGPWKPAHVAAAVDYAHARVEALDEEIERRRTIIEQTPGAGYARLLAAGFGEASRQQKMEELTVMETDLAEDFDRREERIRTDVEGEEFLRRGRLLVLKADREAATLAERGRVIG